MPGWQPWEPLLSDGCGYTVMYLLSMTEMIWEQFWALKSKGTEIMFKGYIEAKSDLWKYSRP